MVDVRLGRAPATYRLEHRRRLPTVPNTWVPTDAGRAIWLGPDEWLLTSTAEAPEELEARVRAAVVPLGGSAADVSAQRITLRLTGERVRDVLAKGCAIDLHPRVFGRGRSAQTTLGLAGVVLLALTDAGDDYLVLVRSSFAGYLADWLLDAALEFTAAALNGCYPTLHGAGFRRAVAGLRYVEPQITARIARSKPRTCSTGEVFGTVGLPGGDGAQQRHVLGDDVHVHGRQPVEEHAVDPRRQVVVADQDVLEVRVVRGPVDRPVHAEVPPHQLGSVGPHDVQRLDPGRELVEFGPRRARGALGGPPRGQGFELDADLRDVREVGDVHAGREGPAPGVRDHQPVDLQPLQRLAHRRAAHAERLRQLVVVDRLAGLDVQHDQLVPDGEIRPVRQGHRSRVQLRWGQRSHLDRKGCWTRSLASVSVTDIHYLSY